jgi:hypothetical protein
MRKLAYVAKIEGFMSIEGCDNIELAEVLGWKVIVRKELYKVDDLVIYHEIDTLAPQWPLYKDDLEKRSYKIKTMKMRGAYSQGYIVPFSSVTIQNTLGNVDFRDGFFDLYVDLKKFKSFKAEEGLDLSDILDLKKYDNEDGESLEDYRPNIKKSWLQNKINFLKWKWKSLFSSKQNKKSGNFPSFLRKTDETRVQNLKGPISQIGSEECYITEKIEGQSGSFAINSDKYVVCSRNMIVADHISNNHGYISKKYDLENKIRSLGSNICVQGELYGTTIQGNYYGIEDKEFLVYSIYIIDEKRYADYEETLDYVKKLDLNMVPIVDDIFILHDDIDKLVELSKGKSVINKNKLREGVVIRTKKRVRYGNIFSFKSINPDYLIKADK